MKPAPVLAVDDLTIGLDLPEGPPPHVIDRVSFRLDAGASIGIAGESGSGKSTLLLALMGVVRPGLAHLSGAVHFEGVPMLGRPDAALLSLRGGRLALIPQNAAMSMTPTLRIGAQIDEALRLHTPLTALQRRDRVVGLLKRVRLPDPDMMAKRYPHELSGGQVQRAAIAMALAGDPAVLLMDEPTTGLDVTTQLSLLDLMIELRRESGMAIVCVSHDLGVLAKLCQRLVVMYSGAMVEEGPTKVLLTRPSHPYTRALLGSLPTLASPGLPNAIPGRPPNPLALPPGCRFAPRCALANEDCHRLRPPVRDQGPEQRLACFHPVEGGLAAPVEAKSPKQSDRQTTVLRVQDLSIAYGQPRGLNRLLTKRKPTQVVEKVSFHLQRGEVLGLVGESGSGKSTILRAIAGIHPLSEGSISLATTDNRVTPLAAQMAKRPLSHLKSIQMVFQNPESSLNPRHTIFELLAQPLRLYGAQSGGSLRDLAASLLEDVRLDDSYLDRFPSQLSGGERQRVAIARAFAADPEVLLCDEITTALDVSVQAAVLKLVRDLARDRQVATIFVSHDLAVVRAISDRIAVLSDGRIVEIGAADDLCRRPAHVYTQKLLSAVLETALPLVSDQNIAPGMVQAQQRRTTNHRSF
jgi:peptide/nickel transport system ATP-binding protein